jgi:curved DNA-binding protein CbpA
VEHERPGPGSRDPYELLGVAPDATRQQIVRAYHHAVQRAHPDTQPQDPGAQARFRALTDAYDVLSDPARRADYDRRRRGHGQLRHADSVRGAGNNGGPWGGRASCGLSGLWGGRGLWGGAAGSGPLWAGPVRVEPAAERGTGPGKTAHGEPAHRQPAHGETWQGEGTHAEIAPGGAGHGATGRRVAGPALSGGEHRDPDVFLGVSPPARYRRWSWPW